MCIRDSDSGCRVTIIPASLLSKFGIHLKLQPAQVRFRSYTKGIFYPKGVANVEVEYKKKRGNLSIYVVDEEYAPLLGRTWIRCLDISLQEIDKDRQNSKSPNVEVNQVESDAIVTQILSKYAEMFEKKVGVIPNEKGNTELRPNVKPVFIGARTVPYALRPLVEKELESLEEQKVLTRVDSSDWGSPLVVIPKADGGVRLCVDYKQTVNPRIVDGHYPLPKLEEVLNALQGGKRYL